MKKIEMVLVVAIMQVVAVATLAQTAEKNGEKALDGALFKEKYRPQFHLTPKKGMLIDPTDLIYQNGKYLVNKRLASSPDLIHWTLHPRFELSNDSVAEMSGSTVIDVNNTSGFGLNGKAPLVAVYSGLRHRDRRQFQCVAYSNDDGRTWKEYERNPVIDIGSTEFRDPHVFWHEQTKKWIMAVALADKQQVRFYRSVNLKDWEFLSDFGPAGAVKGVWECPDLFPLAVDGNNQNIKWVLAVSVQPLSGQYFVGSFDGKSFSLDPAFGKALKENQKSAQPAGQVLFDFESDLNGWQSEGTAFFASPAHGSLPDQNPVLGFAGKKLINSFHNRDEALGSITSPEFLINKNNINFLIGGGANAEKLSVSLIVDGKLVRTTTGTDAEVLNWASWDVSEFRGKKGRLKVIDHQTGDFGHILLDQVMLSDTPAKNEREKAFWIDYGPDFYAVRSWNNMPTADQRRIWVAWLGSWLYIRDVPTGGWKGGHTFPRSIALKTFPQGIRLVQSPIAELEQLRGAHIKMGAAAIQRKIEVGTPKTNSYEIVAEFELSKDGSVAFDLCADSNQRTTIIYNAKSETLLLDRSRSGEVGFNPSFPGAYSAPLRLANNKLKLRILVDQSNTEIFANDGIASITAQIFPDPSGNRVYLYPLTGKVRLLSLHMWDLKSIWGADAAAYTEGIHK